MLLEHDNIESNQTKINTLKLSLSKQMLLLSQKKNNWIKVMDQQDVMQYEPEKQIIRKEICKQYQLLSLLMSYILTNLDFLQNDLVHKTNHAFSLSYLHLSLMKTLVQNHYLLHVLFYKPRHLWLTLEGHQKLFPSIHAQSPAGKAKYILPNLMLQPP